MSDQDDILDLLTIDHVITHHTTASFGEQLFEELHYSEKVEPIAKGYWLRGSRLAEMCPREELLTVRYNKTRVYETKPAQAMAMGIGHQFHRWIQNVAPKLLVGAWKCLGCKYRTDSKGQPPRIPYPTFPCPQCKAQKRWWYKERSYVDRKYRVRGHPDGFRRLTDDPADDEILEFKTQFEYGWKTSSEPYDSYLKQVQVYLWLTGLKRARVIMVNKNGAGDKPKGWFKESVYGRDEFMIAKLKKIASDIGTGMKENALAGRICEKRSCERAKGCDMVAHCFATDEGVEVAA